MRAVGLLALLAPLPALAMACLPDYGFTSSTDASIDAPTEDAPAERGSPPVEAGADRDADAERPKPSLQDCVLLMDMEETTWVDAAVRDYSGQSNHGVAVGTARTTPAGKFGRAAILDGSGWIAIPGDAGSLQPTTALTYAAWIYPTGLTDGARSPGIFAKRRGVTDQVAFTLFLYTNHQLWVDVGASTRFHADFVFANDQWYHVAVVYDASLATTMRTSVYVNGVPDGTPKPADPSIATPNVEDLLIGNLPNGGDTFVGRIDEVAIWKRALSAAEIKQLHDYGAPL